VAVVGAIARALRLSRFGRLLQNSLGGTARTCIIACVSPRSVDVAETTDTLKYAERARQIRTRPIANVSAAVVDPARLQTGIQAVEAAFNLPQRLQAAGSAVEQATSSSFLPDAPPDSALEDTATARLREQQQERRQEGGGGGAAPPAAGRQRADGAGAAEDEGQGVHQRMLMLSLEAEGSAQQQQSSGAEAGEEDGPQDMVRSPAPVTSRRMPPPPTHHEEEGEGE
jgi:hypothetical protein